MPGATGLVLSGRARSQLASLPIALQDAVKETLADLTIEPEMIGKPLLGRLAGLWAARVGNYRLLLTIEAPQASRQVVVRSIRHRAVAYGRRRRGKP